MTEKLRLLEQRSLPRIITYLKHKKTACRSDLKRDINASQQAIYNALAPLMKHGLIKDVVVKGSPRRKDVSLTKKGRDVAELLEKLGELL